MAKSNAQLQKDKRAKEKALLDRIGAEKRSLIVSKALDDALQVLGERHDFEEWQETVSTLIINLAATCRLKSQNASPVCRDRNWSLRRSGRGSLKSSPRQDLRQLNDRPRLRRS